MRCTCTYKKLEVRVAGHYLKLVKHGRLTLEREQADKWGLGKERMYHRKQDQQAVNHVQY